MGFFSWKTSDTKETIWNSYTPRCRPVYLYCPDGTVICEPAYEGYGVFGGYDSYALLAKWNAPERCVGDWERDRDIGIEIAFADHPCGDAPLKFPLKFSFSANRSYDSLPAAECDPHQGYFGNDDEDDE